MRNVYKSHVNFLNIFLLILIFNVNLLQEAFAASHTNKSCPLPTMVVDLGKIATGKNRIKAAFPWTNNEREVLEIEKVLKGCSCVKVTPIEGKIEPGQTVEFTADIDTSDLSGNAEIQFAVLFKNRAKLPVTFKAKFYKPLELQAKPKLIDFGIIENPLKSFRKFNITWVFDPNESGLEVLPNIFSTEGMASCRLLDHKRELVRLPSAQKPTIRQEFLFQAFLRPELKQGEFHDTIKIPIVLENRIENVIVPVVGSFKGKIFSTPSKIFSFIPSDKIQETNIKAALFRQSWLREPQDVNVICSDSRLSVALRMPKTKAASNLVGTINIAVRDPICSNVIESKLNVSYKIEDKKENFDIPMKIVIIDGTVNGN